MDRERTLTEMLDRAVARSGHRTALTFLQNGETAAGSLTWDELRQRAWGIAAALQERCLSAGDRAVLVYPEGVDFLPAMFGCLYAGVIAVPAPAPDSLRGKRSLPHLRAVADDAAAQLILTTSDLMADLGGVHDAPLLSTDGVKGARPTLPEIRPDHLAYLQYTSGSTGAPKGVMISHANLIANIAGIQSMHPYLAESVALTWMPHTHDFGLVEGLLRPLLSEVSNYVISPWAFLRRPLRWLAAISTLRVTHSSAASFAFRHCLQQIPVKQRGGLDLRSWAVSVTGAEPIQPAMLQEFSEGFAVSGFSLKTFCPAFGLAEATLLLTTKPAGEPLVLRTLSLDGRQVTLTGNGRPVAGVRMVLVDPVTRRAVQNGEPGEAWFQGDTIARGYWQKTEYTAEVFQARLDDPADQSHWLRTGDICVFEQNELFVCGRLKDLIIINGQNYHPADIEWAVAEAHPLLRHGAKAALGTEVFSGSDTREHLVILCEVELAAAKAVDPEAVALAIRERVAADFALPVHGIGLLRRGTLPLTPSGKIRRSSCLELWKNQDAELQYRWPPKVEAVAKASAPRTDNEKALAAIWSELLGVAEPGSDEDFFALGGNSLLAVSMLARIEESLGVSLAAGDAMLHPTIRRIAQLLAADRTVGALFAPGDEELRRIYDLLGEPRGYAKLMGGNSLEPPATPIESIIRGLPVTLAFGFLFWLVRQSWAQKRYWPKEVQLIRRFHAVIHTAVNVEAMIANSLLFQLMYRNGFHQREAFGKDDSSRMEGIRHLQAARERGCGVLLVGQHTLAYHWTHLEDLAETGVIGMEGRVAQAGLDAGRALPVLMTRMLEVATQALHRGGVVVIVPDGHQGLGKGQLTDFQGRLRKFQTTFAEMAVSTGAAVVPFEGVMEPGEPVGLRIGEALAVGEPSESRESRVARLMAQYLEILDRTWRETPWAIPWPQMQKHLEYPPDPASPLGRIA